MAFRPFEVIEMAGVKQIERAGCENDRVDRLRGAPNHTCADEVCIDAYRNYTRPWRETDGGTDESRLVLTSRYSQPEESRHDLFA